MSFHKSCFEQKKKLKIVLALEVAQEMDYIIGNYMTSLMDDYNPVYDKERKDLIERWYKAYNTALKKFRK